MQKIFLLITLLVSSSIVSTAQEFCGFEKSHLRLMQTSPAYRNAVEKEKQDWAKFAEALSRQRLIITGNDTVFEIPVVIHVIHTGGAVGSQFNPSDSQLIKLIDFTNKCYQATWPGFPSVGNGGTYVPFKFTLAQRDPGCMTTNGIVRVDGSSLPNYVSDGIEIGGGPGASETAVKALSDWPHDKYYNIWVVNYIGGPGGGTAGYAYYPGAGQGTDGTVILASVAQSGSTTLAHEMGHGMGLPHTFEGDNGGTACPPNNNCNIDGDGICDTEPHMRGVTCTDVTNPCTNQPYGFTRNSFMSYSHGCRDRFTSGQRTKMHYNLMANRTSLMLSDGALPPPARAANACIPVSLNPASMMNCGPQAVSFHMISNISGGYNTEGIYVDNFCEGRTEVYTGNSYAITVQTGPLTEDVKVFIDYNNDSIFQTTEQVFSSNGTTANQIHSGTVAIPSTGVVLCQPLRMRVVSDIASAPFLFPCGPLERGQAEDYVVTVKPPANATINALASSTFPYCEDSIVTFGVNTANVPPGATITWLVNGVEVANGATFSSAALQAGDQIWAKTVVNNVTCNTPDTIISNPITVSFLQGPPAPVISFINGDLISNIAPVYWFGPNGIIPGVTGQVYHPTQYGNYYATAVGNPCPSDSSNVLFVSLLDVDRFDIEQISFYPNPVKDELTVDAGELKNLKLTVYNTLGQSLINTDSGQERLIRISTRSLPNGIFFVAVTDEHGNKGTARIQVLH